jgi:superfamily II DNA/RNA helicase
MPHTSRRPRASSGRRSPARGPRTPRSPQAAPHAELDRALDAAAAASPPAAATFAELGLDPRLVRALAAGDIHEPFAIQARALPDALAGRDVLGRAQTGSGKTLAFGLPLLTRLAAAPGPRREKTPRGLVLVPTRELAQQVADVLVPLGRAVGVSIATVYGGVSISAQIARVRHADIVVATPGRLIDLLERHACTLSGIQVSVLDEADHMADLGFLPAVTQIIDQTPADGQRMLFSATLDRNVGQLVTRYTTDAALHAVTSSTDSGPAEHRVLVLSAQDKVAVAAEIASRPGRTLFFVRTKHGADRLVKQLTRAGIEAAAIHGDRNQNQRQRALDAFATGHPRVLVATDVAARGIHVDDVDLVVQFDPPNDHKDYLHRSGRTARAGASGMVIALVEHGQLRELRRLHDAAGVTAASDEVAAGHQVVRQIAASGTPVPPAPVRPAGPRAHTGPTRRTETSTSRSRPEYGVGRLTLGRARACPWYRRQSLTRPGLPETWSGTRRHRSRFRPSSTTRSEAIRRRPAAGRHETGNSLRQNAMDSGFHGVLTGKDQGSRKKINKKKGIKR